MSHIDLIGILEKLMEAEADVEAGRTVDAFESLKNSGKSMV